MNFLKSRKFKIIMNFIYGFGASIVMMGALFKIIHLPGANEMLIVGLTTEAFIFAISAFEPPHEEVDWTLVYPELAGLPGDENNKRISQQKDAISQELDKLLEEAKIGPELIESLGTGLRKLGESTEKLGEMTDAGEATSKYIDNVSNAATTVDQLSASYVAAAESLTKISETDSEGYGDQLQRVSKNLGALNSIYELQIQESQEYLDSTSKVYANISTLLDHLNNSVEDTKKYKEEIHTLGTNLAALNTVYGNMLTAMNVNRG